MHFPCSSSVCVTRIKPLYSNINWIASFHIVYKKNIVKIQYAAQLNLQFAMQPKHNQISIYRLLIANFLKDDNSKTIATSEETLCLCMHMLACETAREKKREWNRENVTQPSNTRTKSLIKPIN